MNRQQEIFMLQALNEAIWIRNKANEIDKQELCNLVMALGEHGIFSSRQISAITGGILTHTTVSKLISKTDKTGGTLNVESLEDLRKIFYSRERKRTDYELVRKVIESGTSQVMVEKLTGVSQSSISRKASKLGS